MTILTIIKRASERNEQLSDTSIYKLKARLALGEFQRTTGICMAVDFEKAFDSVWVKGLLYRRKEETCFLIHQTTIEYY